MASVIPRSKNKTLAPNFAPSIELTIPPVPVLPFSVLQLYRNTSSDRLIMNVPGTLPDQDPLLLFIVQFPFEPSLNDNETGTLASFTIVEHEANKIKIIAEAKDLIIY